MQASTISTIASLLPGILRHSSGFTANNFSRGVVSSWQHERNPVEEKSMVKPEASALSLQCVAKRRGPFAADEGERKKGAASRPLRSDFRRPVRKAPRCRANAAEKRVVEGKAAEENPEERRAAESLRAE